MATLACFGWVLACVLLAFSCIGLAAVSSRRYIRLYEDPACGLRDYARRSLPWSGRGIEHAERAKRTRCVCPRCRHVCDPGMRRRPSQRRRFERWLRQPRITRLFEDAKILVPLRQLHGKWVAFARGMIAPVGRGNAGSLCLVRVDVARLAQTGAPLRAASSVASRIVKYRA